MSILRTFSAAASRPFFTPPITGVNGSNYWEQIGQLPSPAYGRTGVWISGDVQKAYVAQPTGSPTLGYPKAYIRRGIGWEQTAEDLGNSTYIGTSATSADGLRAFGRQPSTSQYKVATSSSNTWSYVTVDSGASYVNPDTSISSDGFTVFLAINTYSGGPRVYKVFQYNGSSWPLLWTATGGINSIPSYSFPSTTAINSNGSKVALAGYNALGNAWGFVFENVAGTFSPIGGQITFQTTGSLYSIFLSSDGNRIAAQLSVGNGSTEYVHEVWEYTGTSWQIVGAPINTGTLQSVSGNFAQTQIGGRWTNVDCTIIAGRKQPSTNVRSVQFYKFNGSAWAALGAEVSGGINFGTYISMTPSGSHALISAGSSSSDETARLFQYIP
jgi:hypothetical protein